MIDCAKKYRENLENKNIIFIYHEKNKINYIETRFTAGNFLHLTGLEYARNINGQESRSSIKFYKDIINNKLSVHNIKIKDKNTIKLKLEILYNLMNIGYSAKMIGTYDKVTKNLLVTDKVVGNVRYCIGVKQVNKFYIPNTSLKEDIRIISKNTNKIVAILDKHIEEEKYTNITYISNSISLWQIFKNKNLKELIDIENLYSNNILYNQKIFEYLSNNI